MLLRRPPNGLPLLEACLAHTREVLAAWTRLHQLIAGYPSAGPQQGALEMEFLHTKSQLARTISTLKGRMAGECRFDQQAIGFIAACTNLHALFGQSEVAVKKQLSEWHRVFVGINEQLGEMEEIHRRALAGERVYFAGMLVYVPRPFPWKKVWRAGGAVAALLLLVGGAWFARNVLGIGAPEAGAGMQVDDSVSETVQIQMLMDRIKNAFERKDLDTVMSAFADDFEDVEGRNKRMLRALLTTYVTTVGVDNVQLRIDDAQISFRDGEAYVAPIRVITPVISIDLAVMGRRINGVWLVTYLSEA